ncbi:MAG: hypothetical protein ACREQ7_00320 [Candidatus Binatia bacterium]
MGNLKTVVPFALSALLALLSCTPLSLRIPAVTDEKLERFMNNEALAILRVSENSHSAGLYHFRLADFPRRDILGLSVGNHQIFISYELTRLAYRNQHHRWLLRQTLAHEIAHDVMGAEVGNHNPDRRLKSGRANRISARDLGLSGMVSFRPYSSSAELQADRKGMEYWRRLGWDCRNWVSIFRNFLNQDYYGDVDHPTLERLTQAVEICPAAT